MLQTYPDAVAASIKWAAHADDETVANYVANVIREPGRKYIAVPGGATPGRIFEMLQNANLPLGKVELLLTDDRIGKNPYFQSNSQRLDSAFIATAVNHLPLQLGSKPEFFDLVWLGMGERGEIAGLSSKAHCSLDGDPCVIGTAPYWAQHGAPIDSLSLNIPAILQTKEIVLVIRGTQKKRILDAALDGHIDAPIAHLIRVANCPITIFWSRT